MSTHGILTEPSLSPHPRKGREGKGRGGEGNRGVAPIHSLQSVESDEPAKACEKCGLRLPLTAFYRSARDGHQSLLCGRCNRGLGLFADDPARLESAARYLSGRRRSMPLSAPTMDARCAESSGGQR